MARILLFKILISAFLILVPGPETAAFDAHTDPLTPRLQTFTGSESFDGKASTRRDADPQPLKQGQLIAWTQAEGLRRLRRSLHTADFRPLANNFEPQKNNILCGPTSSVIVLNALRGRGNNDGVPTDPTTVPEQAYQFLPKNFDPLYKRYTQNTFFNDETDQVKTLMQVYGEPMPTTGLADYGLQLRQLHDMLLAHDLRVTIRIVDGSVSRESMRREIIRNLRRPDDYVVVNFSRRVLGQPGGGHFSPLGAYDVVSDSFLVMDTVPLVADWFWVAAELLFDAMETFDTLENRGYLLISEGSAIQ